MSHSGAVQTVLNLKKSLASAGAADRTEEIKRILQQLKTDIVVTEELIRETKIGIAVNKLRQNPSKDVADLAKDLVRKWKADVGATGPRKGDSPLASALPSPSPAVASPPASKPEPTKAQSTASSSKLSKPPVTSAPAPAPAASKPAPAVPAQKRRESLNGAPRTHKTDGITFGSGDGSTGDKTGQKCVEMIYDALASDSDAPTDLILKRARALEKHVYGQNPPPEGTNAYRQKIRSLYLNLKAQNNPGLREGVVSGEISIEKLYTMGPAELASEEQQAANRKIAEENIFKARGAAPQQAETDAFQCGKCKQRRTMYYQMQTRSADEPMTTFVTCLNCNNRWKFS